MPRYNGWKSPRRRGIYDQITCGKVVDMGKRSVPQLRADQTVTNVPGDVVVERTRLPRFSGEPIVEYKAWICVNERDKNPNVEHKYINGRLFSRLYGGELTEAVFEKHQHLCELQEQGFVEFPKTWGLTHENGSPFIVDGEQIFFHEIILARESFRIEEVRNKTARNLTIIEMAEIHWPIVDAARFIVSQGKEFQEWKFLHQKSTFITTWRGTDHKQYRVDVSQMHIQELGS